MNLSLRTMAPALGVLLAALLVSRAMAQETGLKDKTDAELGAILSGDQKRWVEQPCEVGLPVMAELRSRHPDADAFIKGELLTAILCADKREDYREGLNRLAEYERRYPDETLFNGMGLYFARRLDDGDAVLALLQSTDVKRLAKLDRQSFWAAIRVLNQQDKTAEAERLVLAWHDKDELELFEAEQRGAMAIMAMRAAISAGRQDAVPGLLGHVRSPYDYIALLADRRFSPAWPQIEERVGEHLERVSQDYVEWALVRLEANGTDRDRFSMAAHALHFSGRYENAIALAQQWRDRTGAIEAMQEGDGWAMNIQAFAYDALGEPEKADAVFDELARLTPQDHPWVVNFVINRASRLVGQGRWEEGLKAAALARKVADKYGSTYAKMIIARDHACALLKLGRGDEVAGELAFLRENRDTSPELAAEGLMCAGEREEALSIVMAAVEDEGSRDRLIRILQPAAFELFYTPSLLPHARDLLPESEALTKAFNRYARIIPDRFTPVAYQRRKHWLEAK